MSEQSGKEYEQQVRELTRGESQILDGREFDSVTDEALIQAKNSQSAVQRPHNFLGKKTRKQIKETIRLAQKLGKRAEFWFKQEPHIEVRAYIEDKQGIIVVWEKETE